MWLNKQDHCQEVLGLKFGSFFNSYNNCLVAQIVISLPETTKSDFFFFLKLMLPLCSSDLFFSYLSIFTAWESRRRCKSDSIQLRLDVRLLPADQTEDDVAMETAGAAVTYGVPRR